MAESDGVRQPGLQDDRKLSKPKLMAGALSEIVLVALFVTSLNRGFQPAWTVVFALAMTVVAVAVAVSLVRDRRSWDRN